MIDPSKQYQTRDGRAVRILCVDAKGHQPVVGLVMDFNGLEKPFTWGLDGSYWFVRSDKSTFMDLVEVPEKRRLVGFVNVYENECSRIYKFRRFADEIASKSRIACLELDVEYAVGEGLDQ